MTIDELYAIADRFYSVFGVAMWRYQDQYTGFDLTRFEVDKCPNIPNGVSLKEAVRGRYGDQAVELVETCLELGSYFKIMQRIGCTVVESGKVYMGAKNCTVKYPIRVKFNYDRPIRMDESKAYVMGCLAVRNVVDDVWVLMHLPSGLAAGNWKAKNAKGAIDKMKLALLIPGIENDMPDSECIKALKELETV